MELSFTNTSRRRDTSYYQKKAEVALDVLLLNNRILQEAYICAEQELNPQKIEEEYTKRLLDLQKLLDEKEPGLGHATATDIASRLGTIDRFTAIGLINFITDICPERDSIYIKQLPEIVGNIKGKNGIDSGLLRYHFVSKILPNRKPENVAEIEEISQRYVEKFKSISKPDEETEDFSRILQKYYKGDRKRMEDDMKNGIRQRLLEDLGWAIKNMETLNDVPAPEDSNSTINDESDLSCKS